MGIKMDNKGFTLVELIAVMVILVSIALVAVGGITFSRKWLGKSIRGESNSSHSKRNNLWMQKTWKNQETLAV